MTLSSSGLTASHAPVKVSVLMITYNHEPFIAQAIESILMQVRDFDYEIVIGEDCSTDATRDIVLRYAEQHPDIIRPLLWDANVGMHRNLAEALTMCQGQYVALLEGDDYWTTPNKLQRQATFLDAHPECSTCFHKTATLHEDGSLGPCRNVLDGQKAISTLDDLLERDFIPTCSVMFRRGLFSGIPDWVYKLRMGDWPLHILNAQHGSLAYLDDVMAAYRLHAGGVWSPLMPIQHIEAEIQLYEQLAKHLDQRYERLIAQKLCQRLLDLAAHYNADGNLANARRYALKSAVVRLRCGALWHRYQWVLLSKLYTPLLYRAYRVTKVAMMRYRAHKALS